MIFFRHISVKQVIISIMWKKLYNTETSYRIHNKPFFFMVFEPFSLNIEKRMPVLYLHSNNLSQQGFVDFIDKLIR